MTAATLKSLWNMYANQWVKNTQIKVDGQDTSISDLCSVKTDYYKVLLKRYNRMKAVVKEAYFGTNIKHVNRYKRAAILAYVISTAEPLEYKFDVSHDTDFYYLKQRLAFEIAIASIILDFPKDKVAELPNGIFNYERLGFLNDKGANPAKGNEDRDDFLTSVYKDLLFAEVHQNYNVLTMANVFGLLTECASELAQLG